MHDRHSLVGSNNHLFIPDTMNRCDGIGNQSITHGIHLHLLSFKIKFQQSITFRCNPEIPIFILHVIHTEFGEIV